jgi:dephospho-CoA kinase
MVIGVAGKYCAGKDTVVRVLEEAGYQEINVDKLGHATLEEKKLEIMKVFGNRVVNTQGAIDRKLLGQIVFQDPAAKKKLETIVHPAMVAVVRTKIQEATRASDGTRLVINAALLFPMGLAALCDAIIWVWAPFLWRLKRALARDDLSFQAALHRLMSQAKLEPVQTSPAANPSAIEPNQIAIELKSGERNVDIYYVGNWFTKASVRQRVKNVEAQIRASYHF